MTDDALRVGLLLNGTTVPAWTRRALDDMLDRTDVEITCAVVNDDPDEPGLDHYIDRVREFPLWAPVGVVHRLLPAPDYATPAPVDDLIDDATVVPCAPEPAPDFGNVLPDDVVDDVADRADLFVRIGFGILKGRILDEPEHGVLSFHHGDLREYRGQPAGFWEYVNDENVAGVTLQRLNETLDGGEIVAFEDVDLTDAHTYADVRRRLYAASETMLTAGVRNVRADADLVTPDSLGTLYSLPEGSDVVRYLARNNVGRLKKLRA